MGLNGTLPRSSSSTGKCGKISDLFKPKEFCSLDALESFIFTYVKGNCRVDSNMRCDAMIARLVHLM